MIDMENACELSDAQLDLASGCGNDTPPPPPPKTCIQACERVENTSVVVCGPVICF